MKSPKSLEAKPIKPATSKPKEVKPKFDTDAFVFKTEISKIEEWLQRMLDDLDDPDVEYPTYDEQIWIAYWIRDLPFYKANNIPYTLTSARENMILGLYEKPKKSTKRK